ncbi:hypothetical protein DY000_02060526 [Brassica cretica]|uniref:Uncharacterized protein n=1 Tax=Brassica cretica TaxID=69181 RepID=A0ABQ7B0B4_BRACR|nr:hypothetical protein DY000_02060526 [Brassica cretica]
MKEGCPWRLLALCWTMDVSLKLWNDDRDGEINVPLAEQRKLFFCALGLDLVTGPLHKLASSFGSSLLKSGSSLLKSGSPLSDSLSSPMSLLMAAPIWADLIVDLAIVGFCDKSSRTIVPSIFKDISLRDETGASVCWRRGDDVRRSERHGEEAGARRFELVAHSGEEIFFKEGGELLLVVEYFIVKLVTVAGILDLIVHGFKGVIVWRKKVVEIVEEEIVELYLASNAEQTKIVEGWKKGHPIKVESYVRARSSNGEANVGKVVVARDEVVAGHDVVSGDEVV